MIFIKLLINNANITTCKLRMSQSSFAMNTSDPRVKAFHIFGPKVLWILWNTSFQITHNSIYSVATVKNSKHYSVWSSDWNFTNNANTFFSLGGTTTIESISETRYGSGNIRHNTKIGCSLNVMVFTDISNVASAFLLSAYTLQCSSSCWCHYFFEKEANVLNCSNITSVAQLTIPNGTMWLVAESNQLPYLMWSDNLDGIQHFEFQNSSIRKIAKDFFSNIKVKKTYLNLANNNLKSFPKTLNETHFSEVYLAGNPIDCNCDMLWFAHWLNTTEPQSQNRIVKDYKLVLCAGGRWNGTQVYNLSPVRMGCFPKNIPK